MWGPKEHNDNGSQAKFREDRQTERKQVFLCCFGLQVGQCTEAATELEPYSSSDHRCAELPTNRVMIRYSMGY
jgi:hypothetical protein